MKKNWLRHLLVCVFGISSTWVGIDLCHADWQQGEVTLRGQLRQGGLIIGTVPTGSQVWLNEQRLPTTEQGRFVFGIGRDAPPTLTLKIKSTQQSQSWTIPVEKREYQIQHVKGVQAKHVNPAPEMQARIKQEAEKVNAARAQWVNMQAFASPFIWPLHGPITGVYGSQRFYNGEPKQPHFGVDIAAPVGTSARAPADAIVTLAEPDLYFSGGTLIMDHGYGVSSTFMHLHRVLVKVGQTVKQGDVVAEVGATGRATGPHLDWRMNWMNERVDPALIMPPMPK
jgi:murein DD-endopeptidase MepM/ murein hydrolase activator NlpD